MTFAVNQTWATSVDELRARLQYWLRLDPARLLWPRQCLACGDPGLDGLDLCGACAAQLPWNRRACAGCALPLPSADPSTSALPHAASPPPGAVLPSAILCGTCLRRRATGRRRPVLDAVHAACVYAAPVDRLLPRFKFHRDLAAGALLAQLMADAFAHRPRPAALVPVPLHRSRLRRRGYDQALELSRPLARALDLTLFEDLLVRTRATSPQSELGAAARRRNVEGAFAVNDISEVPAHVVLVDDVMTTGATLTAAAQALRRAGAVRVEAWVCARAP